MILFHVIRNTFLTGIAVRDNRIVSTESHAAYDAWDVANRAEVARFIRKMSSVTPYRGDELANEVMDSSAWMALEFSQE